MKQLRKRTAAVLTLCLLTLTALAQMATPVHSSAEMKQLGGNEAELAISRRFSGR